MGPDFRLAQRAYKDYPGMYTLEEIASRDWKLLTAVPGPRQVAHLPRQAVA